MQAPQALPSRSPLCGAELYQAAAREVAGLILAYVASWSPANGMMREGEMHQSREENSKQS